MTDSMNQALRRRAARASLCALLLSAAVPCAAAELVVTVSGLESAQGSLGCALLGSEVAVRFPLDQGQAITRRQPAQPGSLQCVFRDLPAGTYAVSAAHDVNGNGTTDRNVVGLPVEPWGVSNGVRPLLRAPRFAEASFVLGADEIKTIELRLQR